jgi:hypothetical protein
VRSVLASALLVVAAASPALAQEGRQPAAATTLPEEPPPPPPGDTSLPSGKFGVIGALRQNIGELGGEYGFGWLFGIDAGYQPTRPGQAFSFGLAWSAMWGRFGAEQAGNVDDPLKVLEMSFGARVRRALGEEVPRFLVGGAGVTVLRTNVPVPPDSDRLYFGGYGGVGVEQYVLGRLLLGVEARYGLFGSGPSGLTFMLSVSSGSP